MRATIAVLPGDGVGPEVVEQAVRVLEAVARAGLHTFDLEHAKIGGSAIDAAGCPLPAETLDVCRQADATLLGAVGGKRWEGAGPGGRPEEGLLQLRAELDLFANIRPIKPHPELAASSPVKADRLEGVDMIFVRELTGGIYFGPKRTVDGTAVDECVYTVDEIARISRVACEIARDRSGKVTSIDKANVLETSRLWRATIEGIVAEEYPDLTLEHMLVDAAAMHLMTSPSAFDVIVTENMFGDILSDEAGVLTGALGNLPSASLGEGSRGVYEPVHGTADEIAGRGVANPFGAIQSAAMLLRHSLGLAAEADAVEAGVATAIHTGVITADLAGPDRAAATTAEVGGAVIGHLAT